MFQRKLFGKRGEVFHIDRFCLWAGSLSGLTHQWQSRQSERQSQERAAAPLQLCLSLAFMVLSLMCETPNESLLTGYDGLDRSVSLNFSRPCLVKFGLNRKCPSISLIDLIQWTNHISKQEQCNTCKQIRHFTVPPLISHCDQVQMAKDQ